MNEPTDTQLIDWLIAHEADLDFQRAHSEWTCFPWASSSARGKTPREAIRAAMAEANGAESAARNAGSGSAVGLVRDAGAVHGGLIR